MSNAYVGDYDGPSPTGVDWQGGQGNWGIAKFGDDRRAIVFFHKQSVFNEIKSTNAGRRIYDEVDFVSIQHPGEREQKIDRPVKMNEDPHRWPAQWASYQKNQAQVVEGTPIDLLLPNHPGIADNLKSAGVTTIEQLANLSSTGMHNVGMGAQDYVNYARAYLDHAQKGVGFHQLQKELSDRDQQIRLQNQRIDTLTQQLDQLLKQNAAILAATPGVAAVQSAAVQHPTSAAPAFSLPPLPARMPEAAAEPKTRRGWPPGKPRKPQVQEEPQAPDATD
jgi:hypothetical protein